ncbi:hypothetical protein D3C76_1040260 [compost metagenome]
MQLVVMEQHQQLVDRSAVETHHQTGQNQRHRRKSFSPRHAKHQRAHHAGPRQRSKLAGECAGQRPERGNGDSELCASGDAERRRFRQRVTQHLLEQHTDQPQPCAHQQGNRQTRQQAVVEQHLLDVIDIRYGERLAPLPARQRNRQI